MIALDTSVVVAAFAVWHEGHEGAIAALARRPRIPAHVVIESYSVLTRLPPPHRAPAEVVEQFLSARFPAAPLTLPGDRQRDLVRLAVSAGLAGGAIYDALVAATVKQAGATLLTRDRRALPAYEAVGVRYELLG
ncbi:MAG: type II toxin-antitoxin system VapC family toxin [Thermoanaerobaculia bacterium]